MSKTIQVRVDDFLKQSADELFNSLGLDTSTAIRIFLTIAIENGGIPFEIKKPNSSFCPYEVSWLASYASLRPRTKRSK